jgi:acid phosphatase family membrane protein YuiD
MDLSYAVTPFLAWLIAGVLKFTINSLKAGQLAFGLIGYGGLPSNHSAIVSSVAALIAFKEGLEHPAFGVALALAFIVMLDANSLRRQVGKHAEALNRLNAGQGEAPPFANAWVTPLGRLRRALSWASGWRPSLFGFGLDPFG